MKRLLMFLVAAMLLLTASPVLAAEVTLTAPANDIVVPIGYKVLLTAQVSGGDSVEFYDGGTYLCTQTVVEGKAEFVLEDGATEGIHSYTASCNGAVSAPVSVTVLNMEEYVISENNFEDNPFNFVISGTETGAEGETIVENGSSHALPGTDFSVSQNGAARVAAVPAPIDVDGYGSGTAMLIEKTDDITHKNPLYLTYNGSGYKPAKNGYAIGAKQHIIIEFDMYMDIKDRYNMKIVGLLRCRPTATTGQKSFCEFDNTGKLNVTGAQDVSWQANKWHKLKSYVDMEGKIMDLYMDGERVLTQKALTLDELFDTSGVASIVYSIGFRGAQKLYLDNIKISALVVPPRISELQFVGADGSATQGTVPYDTAEITMNFSTDIDLTTIYEHLSLFWKHGEDLLPMPFEYTLENGTARSYTIKLPYNLRQNASYILKSEAGVADIAGNVNGHEQTFTFATATPKTYVKSLVRGTDEAELVFVNGTAAEMPVKAVTAVYQNGELAYMHYVNLTMNPGENTKTISLDTPISGEKQVYIWSDDFVPYSFVQ